MKSCRLNFVVLLSLLILCVPFSHAKEKVKPSQKTSEIQKIDFKNFTYHTSSVCREHGIPENVQVKDGKFKKGEEAYFEVGQIFYSDLTKDGKEEAVVTVTCAPIGANYSSEAIFVYALQNGVPALIGTLDDKDGDRDYSRYYPQGGLWFSAGVSVKKDTIIVERCAEGSHAMPKYVATMVYRWNGNKFVLVGKPQRRLFE